MGSWFGRVRQGSPFVIGALGVALALGMGLGLSAARRLPPPTPPAGFYKLEGLNGPGAGRIVAYCFAPGHGGQLFGEGYAPREGIVCSAHTLTRVGDGWDARQQCTEASGSVGTHSAMARRDPDGRLVVTLSVRPRSSGEPLRPNDVVALRRLAPRCPPPLRPGEFVQVSPAVAGGWRVQQLGRSEDPGRPLTTLPPAIAALARQP